MHEQQKRAAARAACEAVTSGMVVGLGSGTTAAYAIEELATGGPPDIRCVPTSLQARQTALANGLEVVELDQIETVDIAIDGADQVGKRAVIKGGGGAHTREKIVDTTAKRLLIVVDERKPVDKLTAPVPLEVIPTARDVVADAVQALGGTPTLRTAANKSGPVITDTGNVLLDCDFGTIDAPQTVAQELAGIPGVIEHGLFVDCADVVYVGTTDGVDVRHRSTESTAEDR